MDLFFHHHYLRLGGYLAMFDLVDLNFQGNHDQDIFAMFGALTCLWATTIYPSFSTITSQTNSLII